MRSLLNNKVLLFIIGMLLLANITLLFFFVWTKEPRKTSAHREKQPSPVTLFLEKEIGFDKAQMAKFEELRQQHRREYKVLSEEIRVTKIGFYQLLSNATVSESTLNQKATEIGNKQKDIDLQAFKNFQEIGDLCTPDQKPRFDSLIPGVIEKMWFSPRKR